MDDQSWIYAVWFRDRLLSEDEEDKEWVAVLRIAAPSKQAAKLWGDHLAKERCSTKGDAEFLWSEVQRSDDPMHRRVKNWDASPLVVAGQSVSHDALGW